MIKILVADIHPVVRLGVKQILSDVQDMKVIDEAGTGQEALNKAVKNDYDVIILGINMPDGNGLKLLQELRKKKPQTAVLIFTVLAEDEYAIRVLKMGAAGYLTKGSAPEELIKAIHKVAQGNKFISSDLAEILATNLDLNTDKPIHENLSDREFQVFSLLATGKGLKTIADTLSLTITTISTYQGKILSKMKLNNRSELVRYAIKNNLMAHTND
jgi:two-component system, NarL family, invasion response regulator UvrY